MAESHLEADAVPRRPPYRPPIGIPVRGDERRGAGLAFSIAVHALALLLLVAPFLGQGLADVLAPPGAGGPGPAGGGGGGRGGTGGETTNERLRYIQVTPPAPEPTPPQPEEKQPEVPVPPEPVPPKIEIKTQAPSQEIDLALTAGIGGGSGSDGSTGNGPGSGGGVGSGVGTGRGSSVGPGTGGGEGRIYPPRPVHLLLPPVPIPERVKGQTLTVIFDVDSTGSVLSVDFNPTKDREFNRRMRERFREYKFHPATQWDGRPVRMKWPVEVLL